jgi:hypothetical protein
VPFGGKSFDDRLAEIIDEAERVYDERLPEYDPFSALGRMGKTAQEERAEKEATLEYFGAILFFFVREYLMDADLLKKVNAAVVSVRGAALRKWPKPFPYPGFEEDAARELDAAMVSWLGARREWREYESRVLPQIAADLRPALEPPKPDPLHYFQTWNLAGIPGRGLSRIQAGLLGIHGTHVDARFPDPPGCWREAYDLIAQEFNSASLLSDDLVQTGIPEIVADACASGGWYGTGWSQARPSAIYSLRLGAQYYPLWRHSEFLQELEGRMTHWRGQMLLASSDESKTTPSRVVGVPIPPGARWQDVSLELGETSLRITICGLQQELTFEEAGFGDRDQALDTLKLFAKMHACFEPDRDSSRLRGKTPIKNRITELRKRLQILIRISGNPIEHKGRMYSCKFQIRLAGERSFPTPGGASWPHFSLVEHRDGRLAVTLDEKKIFRARHAGAAGEAAQGTEPVTRFFSFEDIGLKKHDGRNTPEGWVLVELLRGRGLVKRRGDDLAVLNLAKQLQDWTGLQEMPLKYAERTQTWAAVFECDSERPLVLTAPSSLSHKIFELYSSCFQ